MSEVCNRSARDAPPHYSNIARRIGIRLRDVFDPAQAEPLPAEHVDLLLRLRHKERDRRRQNG